MLTNMLTQAINEAAVLIYLMGLTLIVLFMALVLIGYAIWARLKVVAKEVQDQTPVNRLLDQFYELAESTPDTVMQTTELQYFPLLLRMDQMMNEDDARNVAFGMVIDYENLPAKSKMGKLRELIRVAQRRGQMDLLGQVLRRSKKYGGWDDFTSIIGAAVNGQTKGESKKDEL